MYRTLCIRIRTTLELDIDKYLLRVAVPSFQRLQISHTCKTLLVDNGKYLMNTIGITERELAAS